jgi:hypothetical protein
MFCKLMEHNYTIIAMCGPSKVFELKEEILILQYVENR